MKKYFVWNWNVLRWEPGRKRCDGVWSDKWWVSETNLKKYSMLTFQNNFQNYNFFIFLSQSIYIFCLLCSISGCNWLSESFDGVDERSVSTTTDGAIAREEAFVISVWLCLNIHSFLFNKNNPISNGKCKSENLNNFLELPLSLSL